MRTYRYFEWATASGGQLSGDQLMDALSDHLTEDGDVSRAMQMLMQRGMSSGEQRMQGLREMLEQLRKRKQQQLDRYDLNSLLNDVREQLDRILQAERRAVEERLQQVPQRLQSLRQYDFLDQQAAQAFQQLLEALQRRARSSRLNGQAPSREPS